MTTSGASTPIAALPHSAVVLLGRPCDNTMTALSVLQDEGVDLDAMILAGSGCSEQRISEERVHPPVRYASSPRAGRLLLEELQPDLVIAACYPWRLSRRARAAARHGVLNIHPSLLPHGRGPDPVFWLFRNGERDAGVTVHLMDDGFDSGPILAQQRIAIPDGMNVVTLEHHLFEMGARLTASLVSQLLAGQAHFLPQDAQAAAYQPLPCARDWIISPLLPAAWTWRFVQAVAPLHGPLAVQMQGKLLPVRRAISWGERGAPPEQRPASTIAVQFNPGWVVFE